MDLFSPENLPGTVQEYLFRPASALLLLIVVFIAAGWTKRLVYRGLDKAKIDVTLTKFFANLARYAILVVGLIAVLGRFGVEVASFAAILAAVGFAVGMALQGTLSNFSAGIMLLLFRPFKVGDLVNVSGVSGIVDEIELFTTNLNTLDNRRIIVPNGAVFGSTIENMTFHEFRRVDVAVGTDYSADLDSTRKVIEAACETIQRHERSKGVQAYLVCLGGSSIDWEARVWCKSTDYLAVKDELTLAVKNGLDAAGIGIPYPQQDLHIDGVLGGLN